MPTYFLYFYLMAKKAVDIKEFGEKYSVEEVSSNPQMRLYGAATGMILESYAGLGDIENLIDSLNYNKGLKYGKFKEQSKQNFAKVAVEGIGLIYEIACKAREFIIKEIINLSNYIN